MRTLRLRQACATSACMSSHLLFMSVCVCGGGGEGVGMRMRARVCIGVCACAYVSVRVCCVHACARACIHKQ